MQQRENTRLKSQKTIERSSFETDLFSKFITGFVSNGLLELEPNRMFDSGIRFLNMIPNPVIRVTWTGIFSVAIC